ncbi:DMT family transporter [Roseivirga sp. E12]|uniref:DMT family transporter n=1 Tax=Roseivirga sp. E12 TaxID=2819237 RepID=UPI001ABCE061|nr:DMT family transporter [Roseivirga sp. E12]MBO3700475.1 DMT family transporter [Roseivirga sp. E12]
MTATFKDFVKLHFIVFLWGFTAIIGKELSISTADVVMYRTGIAAIVVGIYMHFRKDPLRYPPKVLIRFFLTGLVIAAHWFLFFESARISNVSVCLAGMATTTFWTSLIEPIFTKRSVNAIEVLLGLIVIGGLYVVFSFELDNVLGFSLAIASAMLSATFSVLNAGFAKKHSHYGITFYEMLAACLFTVIFIPIYKVVFLEEAASYAVPAGLEDWGFLILLSVVCTVYAFSASVELMKRISAFAVNLAINMEPVYGILMALLIYGESEQMSNGFYLGTLIIMVAVFSYPMIRKYQKRVEMRKVIH